MIGFVDRLLPSTKVYTPVSFSHPGVYRGHIRTGLIHNLIKSSPLTFCQLWIPVFTAATYFTWLARYQIADALDDVGNMDYKKWLAEREVTKQNQDMQILWKLEAIDMERNHGAGGGWGHEQMMGKKEKAAYVESEEVRVFGKNLDRLMGK